MNLDAKIEAILYYRAEPVSYKELGTILSKNDGEIKEAILNLNQKLLDRGVSIIEESDAVELRSSPKASSLIESMKKDIENKELTKSALETLSIVLYKGPITRRDIDFIRGVNSSFILRTLSSRGLIKRSSNSGRENIYESTSELHAHLGISSQKELPEFGNVNTELDEKIQNLVNRTSE